MDIIVGIVVFVLLLGAGLSFDKLRRQGHLRDQGSTRHASLKDLREGHPLVGRTKDGYIAFSREGQEWSFIRVQVNRLHLSKIVDAESGLSYPEVQSLVKKAQVVLGSADDSARLWHRYFL